MAKTFERTGSERWLRRIAVLLAIAAALVLPVLNPGSGTSVNLHQVDDAAAVVRADHHAKPLPAAPVVASILLLVGLTVTALRRPASPLGPIAVRLRAALDASMATEMAGDPWCRTAPVRRGPPALV